MGKSVLMEKVHEGQSDRPTVARANEHILFIAGELLPKDVTRCGLQSVTLRARNQTISDG